MTAKLARMRRWAIVGFGISILALQYLMAWWLDPEMRELLLAQFGSGYQWHLPEYIEAPAVTFMLLNMPTAAISTVALLTVMDDWTPVSRAIGSFAIWWLLTPPWWWFLGTVGRRRNPA